MGTGYWLAVPCYHGEIRKTIGAFQLKKCIISGYFYQISLLLITTNHPNRQYLIFYNLSIKINCEKKYVPKNTHMTLSSAVAMSNSTEFILLVAHNSDSVCCPATAFFFFFNPCHDATPTSNFQPIRLLDPGCWYKNIEWQCRSRSVQKPADLDLHCLQRQGMSGFSRTRVTLLCPQLQRSWRGILLLGCSSVCPLSRFLMHSITLKPWMLLFWNFIHGFLMKK